MSILTLHLLQWRVVPGDVDRNLQIADSLLEKAQPSAGHVVLLPEMFSSGFYYADLTGAARRSEQVLEWMSSVSQKNQIYMAGSVPINSVEGVSNTMFLFDRDGRRAASYSKLHLFYAGSENLHFVPGREVVQGVMGELEVGLAICFDLRFPEMTRKLCDEGARLVLVSAQWPAARVDHFRDFVRVRAMENQVFVAAVNSCGDDGRDLVLGGGSTVVGPWGDVKGVLDDKEGILTVNVDPGEVEKAREDFPVLKVRRRDLFKN